jgi:hypothetical protein
MKARSLVGGSVLAVVSAVAIGTISAQTVDDVFPYEPIDGARVGPKPILRVGVEGLEVLQMYFRIELSRDDFDTIAYTFDQKKDPARWGYMIRGFEGPQGGRFLVREPLEDGVYDWRVAAWNGFEWVDGKTSHRLIVDAVPPADVDGLAMTVDPVEKSVSLSWEPVTTDRNGAPEYVAKYHVYRYTLRSFFFVIRPFQIATVDETRFVDRDPKALAAPLLFYKITAEDDAGNEPERRY